MRSIRVREVPPQFGAVERTLIHPSGTFSREGREKEQTPSIQGHEMKTIGLIGGTSWESTADYYRLLNEGVRDRLGGFNSCKLLLSSVNFAPYEQWMRQNEWDHVAQALAKEARALEAAGADVILLGTNTMHKVAAELQAAVAIPFMDIRTVCGSAIANRNLKRPLLLGTRYVMENDFFADHLARRFQLEPIVPNGADCTIIHNIIFGELIKGVVLPGSKAAYLEIIAKAHDADGVILGCTEIGMLLKPADFALPLFDTLRLHVKAALDFAI